MDGLHVEVPEAGDETGVLEQRLRVTLAIVSVAMVLQMGDLVRGKVVQAGCAHHPADDVLAMRAP